MQPTDQQQHMLRQLPGVDQLLLAAEGLAELASVPKSVLLRSIRDTLTDLRRQILEPSPKALDHELTQPNLMERISNRIEQLQAYNLTKTINATGVVVHTNLGRSCLAAEAMEHLLAIGGSYSNLEFDLKQGKRGSRYSIVEDLLCELSGSEAALAVNNNAGAVLLCLDTLARGKEAILSRGEMVEIGGSFRIPDVMAKSGAILKEIGTTNRTHLKDYKNAIGSNSGLLLKVHTSNYSIQGFTSSVTLEELVDLGRQFDLPVMEDLGSGTLIDFSQYGLTAEPTVQKSVAAGTDVVTFSGDKLLGGPQAGLILGKRKALDAIKTNPLTRALRIDKLTLAALEATLRLYRDEAQAIAHIPTLAMLTAKLPEMEHRAGQLAQGLRDLKDQRLTVELRYLPSRAGGGALPMLDLPSCCVGVRCSDRSADKMEKSLRRYQPAIVGRIENDEFLMDPRTIRQEEIAVVIKAFSTLLNPQPTKIPGES
jgi:L-seryl-tRNA(Ser) seleniumtransferase